MALVARCATLRDVFLVFVILSAFASFALATTYSVAGLDRKIEAGDSAVNSNFGSAASFDTSGLTLAIGAVNDDTVNTNVGAVYVYTRTDSSLTTWATETKINLPGGTPSSTHFGRSVSLSGDGLVLLIGAYNDQTAASAAGAAYVYQRPSSGSTVWSLNTQLLASDAVGSEYFGWEVALSPGGIVAVVSARYDDDVASNAGSVFVYTRSSTASSVWTENKIVDSDGAASDYFGESVAIDDAGLVVAVGVYADDVAGATNQGSVRVYTRTSTASSSWSESAKLLASDGELGAYFGRSVELDSSALSLVVGAYNHQSQGAVYSFSRASTSASFVEHQKLVSPLPGTSDSFGYNVALSSSALVLVVSQYGADVVDKNDGMFFVFSRASAGTTAWAEQRAFVPEDPSYGDSFSNALAISADGSSICVGVQNDDIGGNTNVGSAYVMQQPRVLSVSAWPLDFGIRYTGWSGTLDIEIFANGVDLVLSSAVSIVGADASAFSITAGTTSAGTISAGASRSLTVTATASTAGDMDAWLRIVTDDEPSQLDVPLKLAVLGTRTSRLVVADADTDQLSYDHGLAVSGDGLVMVAGARYFDGNSGAISNSGAVYVYRRTSTVFTSWTETLIEPADPEGSAQFGHAASLNRDGTVLAVGSLYDDASGVNNAGAVYVYQRSSADNDVWTLNAKLEASNGASSDHFGSDVALSLSGLTLIVGAYTRDVDGNNDAGAVYFLTRASTGSSSWTQTFREEPAPRSTSDHYGYSVAMGDDLHAVVGARYRDIGGEGNAGAVFVLDRASTATTSWFEVELNANTPVSSDQLGWDVDVSEDGLVVVGSARLTDVGGFNNAGSVFIFTRASVGGAFTETVIVNPAPALSDYFGIAVAVSGDGLSLLVGVANNDDVSENAGKAYLYTRPSTSSNVWTQEEAFLPPGGQGADYFGNSVALDSDASVRAVGAYGTTVSDIQNAGVVMVYTEPEDARLSAVPNVISFGTVLLSNSPNVSVQIDVSGWDATVSSTISIVGADASDFAIVSGDTSATAFPAQTSRTFVVELQAVAGGSKSAALRVASDAPSSPLDVPISAFVLTAPIASGSTFSIASLARKLQAGDSAVSSNFGSSVSFDASGLTLAIGAVNDDTVDTNVGAAYVYTRTDASVTTWATETKITLPGGTATSTHFGRSVCLSGDGLVLLVGAYNDQTAGSSAGAAYVYQRPSSGSTVWSLNTQLLASDAAGSEYFGWEVVLSPDGIVAVVSARYDDDVASNAGSVFVYTRSSTSSSLWTENKIVDSDGAASDYFGESVAIDDAGLVVAVGAYADDVAGATNQGSVRVYTRTSTASSSWSESAKLLASDGELGAYFGRSVELDSSALSLVVGAYNHQSQGAVYSFSRASTSASFVEHQKLVSPLPGTSDSFGYNVALSSSALVLVVSQYGADVVDKNDGMFFVFSRASAGTTAWAEQRAFVPEDLSYGDSFSNALAISADGSSICVGVQNDDIGGNTNVGSAYVMQQPRVLSVSAWPLDFGIRYTGWSGTLDIEVFANGVDLVLSSAVSIVGADASAFSITAGTTSAGTISAGASRSLTITATASTTGDMDAWLRIVTDDEPSQLDVPLKLAVLGPSTSRLVVADADTDQLSYDHGLAVSGDGLVMVAGARYFDGNSGAISNSGAVYVYRRTSTVFTSWTETLIEPADPEGSAQFGHAASLNGDGTVLAVGSLYDDASGVNNAGAVYVYQRSSADNDVWTLNAKLEASNGASSDHFGSDVALSLSGLTLTVGAYTRDVDGNNDAGAVYFLTRASTASSSWTQTFREEPAPRSTSDHYGYSVAMGDDLHAVVGARYRDIGGEGNAGAVFVLDRASTATTSWSEVELNANTPVSSDQLGWDVDVSEDGLVVVGSARLTDVGGFNNAGSVFIFTRASVGGTFTETVIVNPAPALSDYFGIAVAVSGDGLSLLVGVANNDDVSENAGKAYLYTRPSTSSNVWTQEEAFLPPGGQGADYFGNSVALDSDGSTKAVGAYGTTVSDIQNAGAVFVYEDFEGAQLTATPSSVGFGTVSLGTAVDALSVQIDVTGWDATVSSPISIVGGDASDFAIVSGDTSATTFAGSTPRTFEIQLRSAYAGAKSAALRVVSDAVVSPFDVPITATVVAESSNPLECGDGKTDGGYYYSPSASASGCDVDDNLNNCFYVVDDVASSGLTSLRTSDGPAPFSEIKADAGVGYFYVSFDVPSKFYNAELVFADATAGECDSWQFVSVTAPSSQTLDGGCVTTVTYRLPWSDAYKAPTQAGEPGSKCGWRRDTSGSTVNLGLDMAVRVTEDLTGSRQGQAATRTLEFQHPVSVSFATEVLASPVNVTVFAPVRVFAAVTAQSVSVDDAALEATLTLELSTEVQKPFELHGIVESTDVMPTGVALETDMAGGNDDAQVRQDDECADASADCSNTWRWQYTTPSVSNDGANPCDFDGTYRVTFGVRCSDETDTDCPIDEGTDSVDITLVVSTGNHCPEVIDSIVLSAALEVYDLPARADAQDDFVGDGTQDDGVTADAEDWQVAYFAAPVTSTQVSIERTEFNQVWITRHQETVSEADDDVVVLLDADDTIDVSPYDAVGEIDCAVAAGVGGADATATAVSAATGCSPAKDGVGGTHSFNFKHGEGGRAAAGAASTPIFEFDVRTDAEGFAMANDEIETMKVSAVIDVEYANVAKRTGGAVQNNVQQRTVSSSFYTAGPSSGGGASSSAMLFGLNATVLYGAGALAVLAVAAILVVVSRRKSRKLERLESVAEVELQTTTSSVV